MAKTNRQLLMTECVRLATKGKTDRARLSAIKFYLILSGKLDMSAGKDLPIKKIETKVKEVSALDELLGKGAANNGV